MAAGKLIALVFCLLLIIYVGGVFGPGPLIPGLGPAFDQIVILGVFVLFAFVAAPWVLRTFRKSNHDHQTSSQSSSAEEVLRQRYARGDLDRNQFLSMLEDLKRPYSEKT